MIVKKTHIGCLKSSNELHEEFILDEIFTRLPVKSLLRFKCVAKRWKSVISSPQFAKSHLRFHRSPANSKHRLLIIDDDNFRRSLLLFDYSRYDNGEITAVYRSDPDSALSVTDSPRNKEGLAELELGTDLIEPSGVDDHCRIHVVGSYDGLVCLDLGLDYLFLWNPATQESRKIPNSPSFLRDATAWGIGYVSSIDDYKIVSVSQDREVWIEKAQTLALRAGKWGKGNVDELVGYLMDHPPSFPGVTANQVAHWIMLV